MALVDHHREAVLVVDTVGLGAVALAAVAAGA
jgi:hypothetical protein